MTVDISHLYNGSHAGPTFGLGNGTGGDVIALSQPGKVDPARMELHEHVEREMVAAGDEDYAGALDRVIDGARVGLITTLSQSAMESAGITPTTRPGRGGIRHDPHTGHVVTLAGAPTSERLGEPNVLQDDADRRRWADTMASCQSRRPGASMDEKVASTKALVARSGGRWSGS
jgi:hypothetical protein